MAYYAIKRELRPLTLGMKRTHESVPADRYTRVYIKTIHKIQLWACNLSLEAHEAKVCVCTYNLITGQRREWSALDTNVQLLPNRSTEISEFTIPTFSRHENSMTKRAENDLRGQEEEHQTVIAAYLYINNERAARTINWPEPLKHVHFQKSPNINMHLTSDTWGSQRPQEAHKVDVSADAPVKGLMLEVVDHAKLDTTVDFEDNGVDLVPGEIISVGVKGLKVGDEHHLGVRYINM